MAEARLDLESCDRLIKKYDPRLQPECIVPIRVRPHHKGKRGGLREKLLEIIEREAPKEVTLTEICYAIEISWELTFLTSKDRLGWRRDAVGRALRRLATEATGETEVVSMPDLRAAALHEVPRVIPRARSGED